MNDRLDLIPAALYARVSSDRQDVDLSVAAQLRALRDYAERNGYLVAREYVDEAESGRTADRPQFRRMLDEAAKPEAPFKEILRLEVLSLHPKARARRRLQGHAPAQGREGGLHHRARRRLPHRQAHGGHHRVCGRVLLGEPCAGSCQGYARGRFSRLLGGQPGALRLPEAHGAGRGQEASHPRTRRGHRSRGGAHLQHGRGGQGHPGHHPHPQRRGHRQPHRQALVQERRPHHPQESCLHGNLGLGH